MTRIFAIIVASSLLVLSAHPVAAQVCGDADGNGTVTVTDGVQTLRAAADLDSPCTLATCDVDGSGAVTVTDGVLVLRKAADLDVTDACPGGSTGSQPETVLRELQPLFKYGVAFATGTPVTSCLNGSDGDIEVTTDADGVDTTFSTCQVDAAIELDGDIVVGTGTLTFTLLEADTAVEENFISDYDGALTLGTGGGGRTLTGPVDVTTDSAGIVTVTFAGATVVDGRLTGGTATVDLRDSDISDSFTQLVLMFNGSGTAAVVATQNNGGTASFTYDIATGTATPS